MCLQHWKLWLGFTKQVDKQVTDILLLIWLVIRTESFIWVQSFSARTGVRQNWNGSLCWLIARKLFHLIGPWNSRVTCILSSCTLWSSLTWGFQKNACMPHVVVVQGGLDRCHFRQWWSWLSTYCDTMVTIHGLGQTSEAGHCVVNNAFSDIIYYLVWSAYASWHVWQLHVQ